MYLPWYTSLRNWSVCDLTSKIYKSGCSVQLVQVLGWVKPNGWYLCSMKYMKYHDAWKQNWITKIRDLLVQVLAWVRPNRWYLFSVKYMKYHDEIEQNWIIKMLSFKSIMSTNKWQLGKTVKTTSTKDAEAIYFQNILNKLWW